MLETHYSAPIKVEAETLIRHYEYVEEIMRAVMEFGSNWERLESFFEGSAGSLKLLTKESKEFASWEAQWKKIVKSVTCDSQLVYRRVCDETTGVAPSRSTLKQIAKVNATLDQLRKGLDDYLEKKRAAFPRYYFLPDERLLRLLAAADPREPVTPELVPALYRNISRIVYREERDAVVGVVSREGEEFALKSVSFKLQSEMEDVLRLTEEQLRKRIGYLIRNVFTKYSEEELSRESMLLDSNAQVALAVDLIAWVRLAEETYLCPDPLGDLYDWLDIQQQQIR
jgi:dynein heavy chain